MMHISVGALYIREYFDKEAKKNVEDMVFYIKNQLKNTIKKVRNVILLCKNQNVINYCNRKFFELIAYS